MLTPYGDRVPGDPIGLLFWQDFALGMPSVTGDAIELSPLDMGNVRKVNAVGLPGIRDPGYFFLFCHIIF